MSELYCPGRLYGFFIHPLNVLAAYGIIANIPLVHYLLNLSLILLFHILNMIFMVLLFSW